MKSCPWNPITSVVVLPAVLLVMGATCASADQPTEQEKVAFFEREIRPLLAEHCYSCHSVRDKKRDGGLLLDSRQGWMTGGDQGPAVVPGDVKASLLIRAVRYEDADLRMPPDKPLAKEVIARLEQWVQMGAPDPRTGEPTSQDRPENPSDPIAGRTHWAFLPLSHPQPPPVGNAAWPRSPIDAFILARLEREKLQAANDADRRTLLRRIYFQLIGLPPTPEQVTEFLGDDRPDALERVVDRLLGSHHFGLRWGRHWLDLARYADSNGLDENFLFREAWRYRNWVLAAVNADVPFDRFVLEQLAGDLLPYDSVEQRDRQRIAAGFLVVGPKVLLGNDPNQRRMDVADEQLDTVGRAILGQTLGCARCHDHKFDPIPTTDYYALAGIFTSTQVMQVRHMLNEQRQMERLVGLGNDGQTLNEAYEKYWREQPQRKAREQHAHKAVELLERGDEPAFGELAEKHSDAVAAGARDTALTKEQRVAAQKELLAQVRAELAAPPAIPPRAMIPTDVEQPADEAVRLAGQFNRLGNKVPRGFLRVVGEEPTTITSGQSGRIELARWLTDSQQGAGRLAARVLANRVWHHLLGRGLVRTVDNFGRTGETASHPELLDYLAGRLIDSGWSVKELGREIVLSRTLALSSYGGDDLVAVDPDNRWLGRAHRRRLEPEALRDAMLLSAERLDFRGMDSTVAYLGDQATAVGDNKNRRRTDFPCRSVYLPVIRNDLPELFEVFDFANPHASTGMRPQTMVAPQGLFLLNDPSVMAAADAAADRFLSFVQPGKDEALVDVMFSWMVQTPPSETERADLIAFVRQTRSRLEADGVADVERRTWSLACHALLATSRFQILD